MPPKKRARCSTIDAQDDTTPEVACRQSSRSNRSVGGHAAQLQKAGEVIAAPMKSRKGRNNYPELDASDPEENLMAPVQLCQGKKSAPAKPRTMSSNSKRPYQRSGNNVRNHPAHTSPHPVLHTVCSSDRFGFKAPTPTFSVQHTQNVNHTTPVQARRTQNIKTTQDNPSKLGFYPPCWQGCLQAAKLQMRLQAVLTHPIPEHQDAMQLVQEVLDAKLWVCHQKKLKFEDGYFPAYSPQMCQLLCDDLFTFHTELKKIEIKKCVIAAATKLLKTGDYLWIPDLSDGKFENFVLQALKDVCLEFFYGDSKKALKNTDDFHQTIPINTLILVVAVMKGVISGFSETGTDKSPELPADRCRADFNKLRTSVDKLLDIPELCEELEEMLQQWAKIGMGESDWHADRSAAGSDVDINIIL
ncbi:uncharacterized protein F5891DRAFT_1196556 [Suillus fuscotomentosus]|uniref:DUF6532 domain-containing protein n=1 Tax=Suillus fuscotomentosus TaxID=1912939 RepID=A0AAD4HD81_9AGAM|nr:uncharacterized protein F5891DRAFT_1196556 [Suillus fuscotomentosus]KAG1893325.1 hypothetical protein F5891DRAFT_1196556 [Suillus fuscotomentosus]